MRTWTSGVEHERPTGPMADLTYELSFKGVASPTLRAAFADCELAAGTGITLVRCAQGALRRVVARIEEFGLELLDVRLIADRSSDGGLAPPA